MKLTRRENLALLGSTALSVAVAPVAALADGHEPKTIEVQMLNKHPDNPREAMVFHPAVIRANVGDTIKFLSTDRGHNSEATRDMLPDGVDRWKSKINDDFELVVEADGTYGFNCTPHKTVGMVGLLLVGDAMVNFEDAKKVRQRGKAKARYAAYFEEAEAMLSAEA